MAWLGIAFKTHPRQVITSPHVWTSCEGPAGVQFSETQSPATFQWATHEFQLHKVEPTRGLGQRRVGGASAEGHVEFPLRY